MAAGNIAAAMADPRSHAVASARSTTVLRRIGNWCDEHIVLVGLTAMALITLCGGVLATVLD